MCARWIGIKAKASFSTVVLTWSIPDGFVASISDMRNFMSSSSNTGGGACKWEVGVDAGGRVGGVEVEYLVDSFSQIIYVQLY